ncbi:MAG: TetR/AcrR family transcriptional regulator [Lentisphaerae bacterium]|nr:TetR/AcrR family transcriptional regulator [Lentisphaerota bacterium]
MKKLQQGKGQRPGIRLNANGIETRKNILLTAGELFTKYGYAGTSFRDITKESNIGLGSLVYHFGVKENLFLSTVSTFFPTQERFDEISASMETCDANSGRDEVINAIFETVATYLKEIHCNRRAAFMPKFYARMMLDATPETERLLKDRMEPVRKKILAFALRVSPKLSEEQAMAWRRCLESQINYTMFSADQVLDEFKLRSFKPDAIDTIARSIAEISYPLLQREG